MWVVKRNIPPFLASVMRSRYVNMKVKNLK